MKLKSYSLGALFAVFVLAAAARAQSTKPGQTDQSEQTDQVDQTDQTGPGQGAASDTAPDKPAAILDGGLLGRTYGALDFNYEQFRNDPGAPKGLGTTLGANLPITDNLDYRLDYGFEAGRASLFHFTDNTFGNGVTTFYKFGHFSPFASADIGYDLDRTTQAPFDALGDRFDHMFYRVSAGFEFPLTQATALRATLGDEDSLRKPHPRDLDYDFSANYWLGSVVGTYVGAVIKNGHGGTLDSIEYTAGLRFSFD